MNGIDGSPHESVGRPEWLTMTRDTFDVAAPTTQLALDVCPVADGCGTGDLFALLDGSLP